MLDTILDGLMVTTTANIIVKLQFPLEEVGVLEGAIKYHTKNNTWEVLDRQLDMCTTDRIVYLRLSDYIELAVLSSFIRMSPNWCMEILEGAVCE
jgi:HD superfamily phosphohydrolase YqeK